LSDDFLKFVQQSEKRSNLILQRLPQNAQKIIKKASPEQDKDMKPSHVDWRTAHRQSKLRNQEAKDIYDGKQNKSSEKKLFLQPSSPSLKLMGE